MVTTIPPAPDDADFVSRLVRIIKSAMCIGAAPDSRPKRRNIYLGAAAIMLALWGWSLTPAIQNWNNPNEDGFSLIPGFYGTLTLLPLGLILLRGGISRSDKHARRARVALVIAIALLVLMGSLEILRRILNAMPD